MAISTEGCFDYVAHFNDDSFKRNEIVLQATRLLGAEQQSLVGNHPKLRFWEDRLVLIADIHSAALVKWISFPVGDAVFFSACAGDRLRVLRNSDPAFALCVTRGDALVLGLGALSILSLGPDIEVATGRESVLISTGGVQACIRPRESKRLGPFDVYIETGGDPLPCPDRQRECGSIVRTEDTRTRNAAIRSAVLLGKDWLRGWCDQLRGEWTDGSYIPGRDNKDKT